MLAQMMIYCRIMKFLTRLWNKTALIPKGLKKGTQKASYFNLLNRVWQPFLHNRVRGLFLNQIQRACHISLC